MRVPPYAARMRLGLGAFVLVAACGGQVTTTPAPDAAANDGQVLSDAASDAPSEAALPLYVYWSRDVDAQSSAVRCPKAGGPTTSYLDQPYATFVDAVDASRV